MKSAIMYDPSQRTAVQAKDGIQGVASRGDACGHCSSALLRVVTPASAGRALLQCNTCARRYEIAAPQEEGEEEELTPMAHGLRLRVHASLTGNTVQWAQAERGGALLARFEGANAALEGRAYLRGRIAALDEVAAALRMRAAADEALAAMLGEEYRR